MSLTTFSDVSSAPTAQRIPLVERRPFFEEALARINIQEETNSKESVQAAPKDSFGVWFEWD